MRRPYQQGLFHPLVWYLCGYLLWMFLPPFFSDNGHHPEALLADLVGVGFVIIGYFLARFLFITSGTGRFSAASLIHWDERCLLLAFITLIYFVRIMLFSDVGIYAFTHPYSRESSLLDTVAQKLSFPYIIFLITLFERYRKPVYLILILVEIAVFIVPVMARSYYILLPLYWFLVRYYFNGRGFKREVKSIAPVLMVALIFIATVGPFINSVRSYVTIGKIESGLALEFGRKNIDPDFLLKRLNIHDEAFNIDPFIHEAAALDALVMESMYERWTGVSSSYRIHPTATSTELGRYYKTGAKTATDFPRNFILVNSRLGMIELAIFNLLFGVLLCVSYTLISRHAGVLFIVLWVPFVYSPAFAGQGAMPSTFVFQYIFLCFSWTLLFLLYKALKVLFSLGPSLNRLILPPDPQKRML